MQFKSIILFITCLTMNLAQAVHINRLEVDANPLATSNPLECYSIGESIVDHKNRFYTVVAQSQDNAQESILYLKRDATREKPGDQRHTEYLSVKQNLKPHGFQLAGITEITNVTYDEVCLAIFNQIKLAKTSIGKQFKVNGQLYTLVNAVVDNNACKAHAIYQKPVSFFKYSQIDQKTQLDTATIECYETIHYNKKNIALVTALSIGATSLLGYLYSLKK